MLVAERAACQQAEAAAVHAQAEAANTVADRSSNEALIAHLKLEIEKLRRQLYGQHSERKERLLDQLELQLEEAEASATEDEQAAEQAAKKTQMVRSFTRRRLVRQPFPEDIERERVVIVALTSCPCCGSAKLSKLIMTAKLNDVDPQASLADVFTSIASLPQSRLHEMLPWEWKKRALPAAAA